MKDVVESILTHEIALLKALSDKHGLELDDLRKLDLIIKAYKTFAGKPEDQTSSTPQQASIEDLLDGLPDARK